MRCAIVPCCCTAVVLALLAGPAVAQISFFDDFDSGASPLWGNEQGGWFASGGVYDSTSASNFPNSRSSLPFSLTDFTVEFDVNHLQDGGVWLRSEEFPGGSIGRVGILLVTGGHLLTGTGLYWHIVSDGSSYGGILNEVTGLFTPGANNAHLRVVVSGNDYSVFVNGAATPATTLNTGAFSSGGVALYDFSPQTFDNFSLSGTPVGHEWDLNGNGAWSVAGNWIGGVPNAPSVAANFGSIITAPRTVSVDIPVSVGTINLNNAQAYTLADGGGTITLDGPPGGEVAINVFAGSHTVAAPLVLNRDAAFRVGPPGSVLTVASQIQANGRAILKSGDGTAIVQNIQAASLNVAAGVLRVSQRVQPNSSAGASLVQSLAISAGASLDLANNGMVLDYSGASPIADVREHLRAGRLLSSTAQSQAGTALGYAEAVAILGGSGGSFCGLSADASAVLIKFTYAGDTNLDGQVDVIDLGNLATGWQTSGSWINGDSNYDGFIDVIDLGMLATNWQAGVGNPLSRGSLDQAVAAYGLPGVAVPEPGMLGMMGMLGGLIAGRRRFWRT